MIQIVFTVALMLWASLAFPGSTFSEESGVTAETPATASQQKAETAAEKQQQVKLSEGEADKIVAARVNGVDIMLSSVTRMAAQLSSQLLAAHDPHSHQRGPDTQTVQNEAINRLILQELAFQQSKKAGIVVEQSAVDETILSIKQKVGGEDSFKQMLANEKLTEDIFRGQVARNIAIERIYSREVLDKDIKIPEDKMKAEYEQNRSKFIQPEKISLVDVVLFMDASDKGSIAKAEEVLKKIKDNNNDPTKLVPDGTFAVRDYEPNKGTDKDLIEEARKLKPGDISGIIKTADSIHIIKLKHYQPEKQRTFDEVKSLIERKLTADEQTRIAKEWFEGLKKEAKIEVLVHPIGENKAESTRMKP